MYSRLRLDSPTRHSSSTKPLVLVAAAVVTLVLTSAGTARATAVDCGHAIVKAANKFAHIRMKRLQNCQDRIVAERMVQPCPNLPTSVKLNNAAVRLRAAVMKRCGGGDHVCGQPNDEPLASIGWDMGTCPNFVDASCTNAITDCDDISTCLECVAGRAVDQALDLYYDAFDLGATDADVIRCQRALGKKSSVLFKGITQTLRKCEARVLAGLTTGPCPDAMAATKINRLAEKFRTFACKACGGPDRECNDIEDQQPSVFGAPADCPDVQVPGGAACAGPITTLTHVVNCALCVTEFKAACLDALSVPQLESYPSECLGAP